MGVSPFMSGRLMSGVYLEQPDSQVGHAISREGSNKTEVVMLSVKKGTPEIARLLGEALC